MNLTVKRLLNMDSIKGIKLVAGKSGIERKITNVNIMDNPDTVKWLKEGEVLLTTGFVFMDNPELQLKIIKEMVDIKCAGLGIKVKRYFEEIPPEMIREADCHGLPIIEIPYEYSLSHISNIIYKEIINKQVILLEKSSEIHKQLTNVALMGGGLEEISKLVVDLIDNPLIVLDEEYRLLVYKDCESNLYPLCEYLHLTKREAVFPQGYIEEVLEGNTKWEKPYTHKFNLKGKTIPCKIWPIAADEKIYGYLVVWEGKSKLKHIDYVAMEHAATVAALERIKEKAVEATKYRIRADFFDELLSGKITKIDMLNNMGELHGLDITKNYSCMIVKILDYKKLSSNNFISDKKILLNLETQISYLIKELADVEERNVVTVCRSNQVIVFIQIGSHEDVNSSKNISKDFAESTNQRLNKKIQGLEIKIGLGKMCDSILDLNKSYKEALEAINFNEKIGLDKAIAHYDDFLIYHLLNAVNSSEELQSFYQKTIAKLVEYDKENNTNLVNTLEVYFLYKGNISEAAKAVFVHRNTMIYRIEKIKLILNTDLESEEVLLELQLGLRIMNLLGV